MFQQQATLGEEMSARFCADAADRIEAIDARSERGRGFMTQIALLEMRITRREPGR